MKFYTVVDFIEVSMVPKEWPWKVRRLFLLTIPISGIIWLLWAVFILFLCVSIYVIFSPIPWFLKMWDKELIP